MQQAVPELRPREKPSLDRFFPSAGALGVALLAWLAPSTANAAEPLDEIAATRRLCTTGPVSAIAKAQRLRGSAERLGAAVLPNPTFVLEHQRSLAGPSDRETLVGLSVPLGIGGRRFLLEDAAAYREDQARAEAEMTLFESALAFREAYTSAAVEAARVEVLGEQQGVLDELSETIRALARGGEAAGYDLLRQEAQARRHKSALESVRARALALRAALEAWTEVDGVSLGKGRSVLAGGTVQNLLLERPRDTPHELGLLAAARASELEARAARRRWVPELDLFAGYRQLSAGDETGHGVSVELTFPITLFDHGQGEAARADAEHALATAFRSQLRREQAAELKAARTRLEGLGAALMHAEEAVRQALDVRQRARTLYTAGETTITEVLESYRAAEEASLARLDLEEEMAKTRLRAMRAAGSMFDASLDRACRGERRRSR
jgi:cobalt-zinc-cadmium efflux system outer membrane protein